MLLLLVVGRVLFCVEVGVEVEALSCVEVEAEGATRVEESLIAISILKGGRTQEGLIS